MFVNPSLMSTIEPWPSLSHSLLKTSKFYLHPRLCYRVSYYLYLFSGCTWKSYRHCQNNIRSEILDSHLSSSKAICFSCFHLINSIPVSQARSCITVHSYFIPCPSICVFNLPFIFFPLTSSQYSPTLSLT